MTKDGTTSIDLAVFAVLQLQTRDGDQDGNAIKAVPADPWYRSEGVGTVEGSGKREGKR